jgi:hypothetical protein
LKRTNALASPARLWATGSYERDRDRMGARAVARDAARGVGGVEEGRGDQPMKSLLFMGVVLALLLISPNTSVGYFIDGNKLVGDMRETEKAERGEPNYSLRDGFFIGSSQEYSIPWAILCVLRTMFRVSKSSRSR